MRTEISSLGEFGLIRRLTDGIELKNESSRYGVGDDAAVLSYPTEKQVLITTDLLMEGVHFDLIYVPLKHLGYKAARELLRYLRREWYAQTDHRFSGSFQAFLRGRYGRVVCGHPSGVRRI